MFSHLFFRLRLRSELPHHFIARRFHQVTNFGKGLDPIADRASQILVSAAMVVDGYLYLWMAIVVLVSDLALGFVLLFRGRRPIPVLPVAVRGSGAHGTRVPLVEGSVSPLRLRRARPRRREPDAGAIAAAAVLSRLRLVAARSPQVELRAGPDYFHS